MFGPRHYVPVLRTKPAELRALKSINPAIRSRITPLLECPPRILRRCETRQELERRCDHIVSHLLRWAGRPVFIDFAMLSQTTPHAIEVMVAFQRTFPVSPRGRHIAFNASNASVDTQIQPLIDTPKPAIN
jgi:Beta protein